ncbi:hypothetical protein [Gemmatimonas sp.]|jgi:hypothetical protein|uniref:hypothetical protein n=1 Tax=Gemmatimonas sp. TaxID=1962908 RepID=UPI0037C0AF07
MKLAVFWFVPTLLALGAISGCDGAATGERITSVESWVPSAQSLSEKSAPPASVTVPTLLLPRIAALAEGASTTTRGPAASKSLRELDSTRAKLVNDLKTITLPQRHPVSLLLNERQLNTLPRLARELGVTMRFEESPGEASHPALAGYVMTYKGQDVMRGMAARKFSTRRVTTLNDPRSSSRWIRPASLADDVPEVMYPESDPNHPYWGAPASDEERIAAATAIGAMVAELEAIVAQLEADNSSSGLVGMTGACKAVGTFLTSSSGPNCGPLKYAAIGAGLMAISFGLGSIAAMVSPEPMSKFAVGALLTGAAGSVVGTMAAISAYNECKQGPAGNNQHPASWGAARRGAMTAPFSTPVAFRGRAWVSA